MSSLDWLEEQISANNIKSFNYAEFSQIIQVGQGGFGNVLKAYWKNRRMTVALKSLKFKSNSDESICEFVREVSSSIRLIIQSVRKSCCTIISSTWFL